MQLFVFVLARYRLPMARAVSVRIVGGLGNQLFGYAAGAALAGQRRAALTLDTSHTRHGITDHGLAITGFDLPGTWRPERRWWSTPGRYPSRAWARLIRKSPWLRRRLRIYSSDVVGHDRAILQLPAGTALRGYFQSWKLAATAMDYGMPRRPELRQPSQWALDLARRSAAEKPLIVHVRRGDYALVPQFGLLDSDYYARAIARHRSRGITGPVWIFSDDHRAAATMVTGEVITGAPDAAHEMWVMSHGAAYVIANSTFSWWAAWMSGSRTPVVAPAPWFAQGPVVDGLIPPEWDLLDAQWLQPGGDESA